VSILNERTVLLFPRRRVDRPTRCILIESPEVAKAVLLHYEAIWEKAVPLKEGEEIFEEAFEVVESRLESSDQP
ncbi:MAG: hypothetical protein AAGM22_27940, partial [Acidobacteriota bacterium]